MLLPPPAVLECAHAGHALHVDAAVRCDGRPDFCSRNRPGVEPVSKFAQPPGKLGHGGSAVLPAGWYGEIELAIDNLDNLCARNQQSRRWIVVTCPIPVFPKSGKTLDSLSRPSREKQHAPSTDDPPHSHATLPRDTSTRLLVYAAPCMWLIAYAAPYVCGALQDLHDSNRDGCRDHDQDHRRDAFDRVSKRVLRSAASPNNASTVSALSDIGIPAGRCVMGHLPSSAAVPATPRAATGRPGRSYDLLR